ncbi:MAG: hypothetical protein JWQ25_2440 [Daejeonella sp.]|nr:hypothetical protein [Daejeonella sp.]
MNLLQLYHQSQFAKGFNQPDIKGIITVGGFSFDIRLVGGEIYCNSLLLEDFLEEGMLTLDERILYEEAIYNWLLSYRVA